MLFCVAPIKDSGGSAQFCLAHLIRDLRFLEEHPDPETRQYAERSLETVRQLFQAHRRRHENPGAYSHELAEAGEAMRQAVLDAPSSPKAQNMAKRFRKNNDAYLRFIHNPEIEPTNNNAERAIRQVVIDRASSQGTRSQVGRTYKERAWTVLTTCAQRGVSAFAFLLDSLTAMANQANAPPLLPAK